MPRATLTYLVTGHHLTDQDAITRYHLLIVAATAAIYALRLAREVMRHEVRVRRVRLDAGPRPIRPP